MDAQLETFYRLMRYDNNNSNLKFRLEGGAEMSWEELALTANVNPPVKFDPDPYLNGKPLRRVTMIQLDKLPDNMRPPGMILEDGNHKYLLIDTDRIKRPDKPTPDELRIISIENEIKRLEAKPSKVQPVSVGRRLDKLRSLRSKLAKRLEDLPAKRKAKFEDKLVRQLESAGAKDPVAIAQLTSEATAVARRDTIERADDLWLNHQDYRSWNDLLELPKSQADPDALICPETRFLCKSGSFLIVAPSGVGKSTLLMQMAICWAAGKNFFGLKPRRPLRCFMLQGENDDGDVAEMVQGIKVGLGLSADEEMRLQRNFKLQSMFGMPDKEGKFDKNNKQVKLPFHELLQELIALHQPEVFFLDPLFAFISGDFNSQEKGSEQFRQQIGPILKQTKTIFVSTHHTPKPVREKSNSGNVDFSYSGFGTSEMTNWYRAVATLRPERGLKKTFRFIVAKRGGRAGFAGGLNYCFMKHAENKLFWEHVDRKPIIVATPAEKETKKEIELLKRMHLHAALKRGDIINEIIRANRVGVRQAANYWQRIKRHFEKVASNKYLFMPPEELKLESEAQSKADSSTPATNKAARPKSRKSSRAKVGKVRRPARSPRRRAKHKRVKSEVSRKRR
ncbi:MAG: AAA family ATPase [Verrucomicrobiota bacterium]